MLRGVLRLLLLGVLLGVLICEKIAFRIILHRCAHILEGKEGLFFRPAIVTVQPNSLNSGKGGMT